MLRFGQRGLVPLGLILLCAVLQLGGEAVRVALRFDRVLIDQGQAWRLLSANFVHLGWYHWMLNALGIVILLLLCPQPLRLRQWLTRLVVLSLGVSLGLWLWVPELARYVGLSGVLHGLFVLGLWPQARQGDRIAWVCLLYLAAKLIYEVMAGAPVSDELAIGGKVITESHLFGALSGLLYALGGASLERRCRSTQVNKGEP